MKLTATREDLLAPLQSVIGVVERRQTMPVLANVLLAARDNRLSVTGTDLEVELVATCPVSVYLKALDTRLRTIFSHMSRST